MANEIENDEARSEHRLNRGVYFVIRV